MAKKRYTIYNMYKSTPKDAYVLKLPLRQGYSCFTFKPYHKPLIFAS